MNFTSLLVLVFCFTSAFADVPVATKCPDGWKWFQRSRGGWCMKVFTGAGNEAAAEAKCQAEGATVSGTQNKEEIAWIGDAIQELTGARGTMWIGAKRTKPCMKSGLTKECSQITSFYWTDKSTVGAQGFAWKAGEPNNGAGGQDCIQLLTDSGTMDDFGCVGTCSGYVCGKVAAF